MSYTWKVLGKSICKNHSIFLIKFENCSRLAWFKYRLKDWSYCRYESTYEKERNEHENDIEWKFDRKPTENLRNIIDRAFFISSWKCTFRSNQTVHSKFNLCHIFRSSVCFYYWNDHLINEIKPSGIHIKIFLWCNKKKKTETRSQ